MIVPVVSKNVQTISNDPDDSDDLDRLDRAQFLTASILTVHTPGGALGYFLGGHVPPGTPNWHPVLKTISPKIDTPF